jgi:hypothetical protein
MKSVPILGKWTQTDQYFFTVLVQVKSLQNIWLRISDQYDQYFLGSARARSHIYIITAGYLKSIGTLVHRLFKSNKKSGKNA